MDWSFFFSSHPHYRTLADAPALLPHVAPRVLRQEFPARCAGGQTRRPHRASAYDGFLPLREAGWDALAVIEGSRMFAVAGEVDVVGYRMRGGGRRGSEIWNGGGSRWGKVVCVGGKIEGRG